MGSLLPAELEQNASVRDGEFGWEIARFPAALTTAEHLGLACLGGQFQFRFDDAIYEMYWLRADPAERFLDEPWDGYVRRSCAEVAEGFSRLVGTTDFAAIVQELPSDLRGRVMRAGFDFRRALVFVAYFVSEQELVSLLLCAPQHGFESQDDLPYVCLEICFQGPAVYGCNAGYDSRQCRSQRCNGCKDAINHWWPFLTLYVRARGRWARLVAAGTTCARWVNVAR